MRMIVRCIQVAAVAAWSLLAASCGKDAQEPMGQAQAVPPTSRIDFPPSTAANLGATFETAVRGRLRRWRTLSGTLEFTPDRQRTVRSPVRGRVLEAAARGRTVAAGDPLAILSSADLADAGESIAAATNTVALLRSELRALRNRAPYCDSLLVQAREFESDSRKRLDALLALDAEGNALIARDLVEARRSVSEAGRAVFDALATRDELAAGIARKEEAVLRALASVSRELAHMATLTGGDAAALAAGPPGAEAWRKVGSLAVPAPFPGVLAETLVSSAELVEAGDPLVTLVDGSRLLFRGFVPEGDLGAIPPGTPVRIEFPSLLVPAVESVVAPPLPVADPRTRTVVVEIPVPNPDGLLAAGLSATARIVAGEGDAEEVLVPLRCVVFDGLEAVVFKKDPANPDVVIRTPVDLGDRNDVEVEVLAGLMDGDAVVADGARQLKHVTGGRQPAGGHFHADGTWHEDHK